MNTESEAESGTNDDLLEGAGKIIDPVHAEVADGNIKRVRLEWEKLFITLHTEMFVSRVGVEGLQHAEREIALHQLLD